MFRQTTRFWKIYPNTQTHGHTDTDTQTHRHTEIQIPVHRLAQMHRYRYADTDFYTDTQIHIYADTLADTQMPSYVTVLGAAAGCNTLVG